MNKGVEILLARMESNPEEFIAPPNTGASRWGHLIESYKDSLDVEDQQAIKEGYKKIHQQRFTEKVMEELLDPKPLELEDVIKQYRATGISSVGQTLASSLTTSKPWVTAGVLTANSNTLTIGNTTIDESHLEHLRAHVDAMKREVDSQELKKPKTIFGRLFNYQ
jgi:hypothetical protein